jgi:hypothetical protein
VTGTATPPWTLTTTNDRKLTLIRFGPRRYISTQCSEPFSAMAVRPRPLANSVLKFFCLSVAPVVHPIALVGTKKNVDGRVSPP